jgi:hypothetical protein
MADHLRRTFVENVAATVPLALRSDLLRMAHEPVDPRRHVANIPSKSAERCRREFERGHMRLPLADYQGDLR